MFAFLAYFALSDGTDYAVDGVPSQMLLQTDVRCQFVFEFFYYLYGLRNPILQVSFLRPPSMWLPRLILDYSGGAIEYLTPFFSHTLLTLLLSFPLINFTSKPLFTL